MPHDPAEDPIEKAFGQPLNPEGPADPSIDPEAEEEATGLLPVDQEKFKPVVVSSDPALPLPLDDGPLSAALVAPSAKMRIFIPDTTGYTEEQKKLVTNAIRDMVLFGARDAALVCRGDGNKEKGVRPCPYLAKCTLKRIGVPLPVGDECPLEMGLLYSWIEAGMREMGINPNDVGADFDSTSIRAMVGMKLSMRRAQWGEALNPEFEQYLEQLGPKGAKFLVQVGNLNFDARERALKAFERLSKNNMQSRAAKWNLTKGGFKDKSKSAAEITERIEKLEGLRTAEVEEIQTIGDAKSGLVQRLSRIHRFVKDTKEQAT